MGKDAQDVQKATNFRRSVKTTKKAPQRHLKRKQYMTWRKIVTHQNKKLMWPELTLSMSVPSVKY